MFMFTKKMLYLSNIEEFQQFKKSKILNIKI